MKLGKYLKDKWISIVLCLFAYVLIVLLLMVFLVPKELQIAVAILMPLFLIPVLFMDYLRKRKFYQELLRNLTQLDKKYLLLETLLEPDFYEGQILCDVLYEMGQDMLEHIRNYQNNMDNYKEFMEMWVHEVKIPISGLILMLHNHSGEMDKRLLQQVKRIENCTEQVLYYTRSENAQKDYQIKPVNLSEVINAVVLRNQDSILETGIEIKIDSVNQVVYTDAKWLEFMLNQIISNSIKYRDKTKQECRIDIYTTTENGISVCVKDNGIGIVASDIGRVFDKTFTGKNGRTDRKATGMGLFIVHALCEKLGLKLTIDSKEGSYTCVCLTFPENSYYTSVLSR